MGDGPAYPGGYPYPPPPPRPGPPPSVQTAVKLMYVGAALSAVALLANLAGRAAIRRALLQARPTLTDLELRTAVNAAIGFGVFVGLVGVGLWLWMAYANGKGQPWARILSTVFFGIDTLSLLAALVVAGRTPVRSLVAVATWAVGLGAIVLLWKPESSAYFNPASSGWQ